MTIHNMANVLPEETRAQSIEILNKYLAATLDLQGQVKHAQWCVRAHGYMAAHEIFNKVSEEVENVTGLIAERAGSLGGKKMGAMDFAPKAPYLVPYLLGIAGEKQQIFDVWEALASFSQAVRKAIDQTVALNDENTADIFIQVMGSVEEQLRYVESQLAPE